MAQSHSTQDTPQPKRGASYHDYAANPRGGVLASPRVAALVLAAAVLFGALYGSHRSLNAARPEFHGTRMEQLFEQRGGVATNLTRVAESYPVDPDLIGKTRDVAELLTGDLRPEQRVVLDQTLTELTGMLMDALSQQPLSERDAGYLAGFRADLIGLANQIARDPYHLQAEHFNQILQDEFPANILGPLTGVQPALVF